MVAQGFSYRALRLKQKDPFVSWFRVLSRNYNRTKVIAFSFPDTVRIIWSFFVAAAQLRFYFVFVLPFSLLSLKSIPPFGSKKAVSFSFKDLSKISNPANRHPLFLSDPS